MKTLLLNDTSSYHNGCKEVINNLKNYYSPTLLIGTLSEIDTSIIEDFDLVVLNGEGTMHHNAQCAVKFLNYIIMMTEIKEFSIKRSWFTKKTLKNFFRV